MHSPAKPLAKIQSFRKPRPAPAAKQTLKEWHAAGGGVPTQYKGREHVWHAMVDKFAAGGAAQPAALIDGNDFVKAAQANGLKTDNATLNKIVARVNKGEGVQEAAKNVAQSRAAGGEVHMAGAGDPAFYPRVGNIKSKNFKPVKPPPLVEDPRAMNLPQYGEVDLSVPTQANLELGSRMAQREADLKRQQQGDRSLPEKIAGVAQAGKFMGSALTQAVNSVPTRIAYGDEAADKFMQDRLYKPEQPTAYEYVDDVGNFLEKLETEYKIPPVLPEATALQSVVGPAASQAKKAVGQGALSLAQSDAAYKLAQKALASPALAAVRPMNVVKPTGGNFLTGRTEKDLAPLKRNVTTRAIENGRYTPEQVAQLAESPRVQANDALNNWVDSNLTNYVKKQMGTADDPVRLMFDNRAREIDAQYAKDIEKSERIAQRATGELDPRKQANLMREAERIKAEANLERQTAVNHISHKPALLDEYLHEPESGSQMRRAEYVKKKRTEAGFPEEGLAQSPMAKAWEISSDEVIATHRAGDIQGMPEKFAKLKEAELNVRAAQEAVERKFKQQMENVGIEEPNMGFHFATSLAEKAKIVGDTDLAKASAEYQSLQSPMMDNYMELGRQNPYINKLDPETPMYAAFTGDLGFDHIMDVLREDLTAGRIRPDQMNKISITDAIRRTSEYDRDLADKMNASRAAAREGLPTYREYPEGYKWIQLNKPGSFAQESEAMGHSVRGYEPPKGHPDWTEASGDAGSSSYGHGGWEAIKSGKAKVYSLVDSKGAPHATVEVRENKDLNPFFEWWNQQTPEKRAEINQRAQQGEHNNSVFEAPEWLAARPALLPRITQIRGKQNRAPNEEYLPYIQDFVKGGQWSDVGDFRNTGLTRKSDLIDKFSPDELDAIGAGEYLTKAEQDELLLRALRPPEEGMAQGGVVRMALGGAGKIAKAAAAKASKKVLGTAGEVPKGVEPIGKLEEAMKAKQAPMTSPQGTGLPLMPRSQGMYIPGVKQEDLPRMPKVDKARAEGKQPAYTERMQDLLDSPTARKKVDKLINKGKDLDVLEWYGIEPLRQVAMNAGRTPEQFESLVAQLASASQRNPVDQQNKMGSYLHYLSQTGQLPDDAFLLTNKIKRGKQEMPAGTPIELPSGYGSLAQGDIFGRGKQIASGDIMGALPPDKKLGTFYRNYLGNLKPVTVDVNAVRGPIIERGDPRWLTSKLVEKDEEGNVIATHFPRRDVAEGRMSLKEAKDRPGFWEAAPSGSEYAGFEDLWQRGAKRHDIEPAEAQALGWYGSADVTALKTKPELYVDNLERMIKRTAEQTGRHPLQVMEDIVSGKGFLYKKGGAVQLSKNKPKTFEPSMFGKKPAQQHKRGGLPSIK